MCATYDRHDARTSPTRAPDGTSLTGAISHKTFDKTTEHFSF